jgi:hypothetical protein
MTDQNLQFSRLSSSYFMKIGSSKPFRTLTIAILPLCLHFERYYFSIIDDMF